MTGFKYIILLLIVLFSSCGNSPKDITEANTYYTNKPVDTIKEVVKSQSVDSALFNIWSAFQQAVSENNLPQFRQLSLDSLDCCDTTLSTETFIKTCYKQVFDTTICRKILILSEVNQIDIEVELGYFTTSMLRTFDFNGDAVTLKQFQIIKQLTPDDGAWTQTFDFIKTKQGYKFFGCDSYGGPICCR